MADFSTIIQSPDIRAIVQENILERAFHDALFPRMLFRGEASAVLWPANVGDTMVFTGVGLIKPKMRPLAPGSDPAPSSYQYEQWTATLQQYADTIDTNMPTSIVAIANLFLRNAQQLGLSAGQTLNRIVRDRMYDAALSGQTLVDGNQSSVTALRVLRINGFTTARNPNTALGSPVRFDTVSPANPLAITIAGVARNVVGYTSDNVGDVYGPGALILDSAISATDADIVKSVDASYIVRAGAATSIDGLTSSSKLTLADIRAAVARFFQQNVPEHADGRFHCHLDPTSQSQIFSDDEFQRLMTSLPDYYMYRQFALGELLGTVFFRNSECPVTETVETGPGYSYSPDDPFAGPLFNADGVPVHRALFSASGGVFEYYQDMNNLLTDAGITGKVGEARITNNGIEVNSERIQLILRAPLNRLQDTVAASWKFIGDWPVRTDATTGDAARYKRFVAIEHGA